MNEHTDGNNLQRQLAALLAEAQEAYESITRIKNQIEEDLKATSESNRKANSEAAFAYNAKEACEKHATSIAELKGKVESDINVIIANKQKSDDQIASTTSLKANFDNDVRIVSETRKEIEAIAKSFADIKQSGTDFSEYIQKSRNDTDVLLDKLKETDKSVIHIKECIEAKDKEVTKLTEQSQSNSLTIHKCIEECQKNNSIIVDLSSKATAKMDDMSEILDSVKKSNERSRLHEDEVKKLQQETQELIDKIDKILPGATSASLASAFEQQKIRFRSPQRWWLITFISCIVLLVLLSMPSFLSAIGVSYFVKTSDVTINSIMQSLLLRMPIAIPLLWLAIYAGRYYMLSARLEEDYAYKEALSRAFEGYKREMEKIQNGDDKSETPPLNRLCNNVLTAMADRPGRIYEGRSRDITIAGEIQKLANKRILEDTQ